VAVSPLSVEVPFFPLLLDAGSAPLQPRRISLRGLRLISFAVSTLRFGLGLPVRTGTPPFSLLVAIVFSLSFLLALNDLSFPFLLRNKIRRQSRSQPSPAFPAQPQGKTLFYYFPSPSPPRFFRRAAVWPFFSKKGPKALGISEMVPPFAHREDSPLKSASFFSLPPPRDSPKRPIDHEAQWRCQYLRLRLPQPLALYNLEGLVATVDFSPRLTRSWSSPLLPA